MNGISDLGNGCVEPPRVAYFSMEIALDPALPTYAEHYQGVPVPESVYRDWRTTNVQILTGTTTPTPTPQLLPAEQLGPITVDGTEHRTDEAVTVRVRVGKSVSTVTCSYVLQDTNQTTVLGTPTTTPIDTNVSENVYTFTPAAAGTYAVNCTGIALTVSGQRPVSSAGPLFAVEAKG